MFTECDVACRAKLRQADELLCKILHKHQSSPRPGNCTLEYVACDTNSCHLTLESWVRDQRLDVQHNNCRQDARLPWRRMLTEIQRVFGCDQLCYETLASKRYECAAIIQAQSNGSRHAAVAAKQCKTNANTKTSTCFRAQSSIWSKASIILPQPVDICIKDLHVHEFRILL